MKKSKTTKKAPLALNTQDHHLICLLSYIDGVEQMTHEPHEAAVRAIRSADSMLKHPQPFDGSTGTPDPVASVFDLTLAEGMDQDLSALVKKMQSYSTDTVIHTDGEHAFGASCALITNGVMLGAALMYRILQGGAR